MTDHQHQCYKLCYKLVALLIAVLCGAQARAQTVNSGVSIGPSQQLSEPASPGPTQAIDAAPVERLFGDWDTPQTTLWQRGINLQIDAITEFAGNVTGGTRQGATFANQIGFEADVNWERLAHATGLSTHLIIVQRSGRSNSARFGDNLLPVQEIYGSGGDVALHLVSVYAQETLYDRRLDVAIGRMNVENDFASSPLYCNFMNNGLCGDPKALPGGDIGHSAYPDAVWAARVRGRPLPELYVETGLYEVNQGLYSDANFRTGFKFDSSQDSGIYVPVEIGWEPVTHKLPGHYKLGFGYDSSNGYKDFGNPLAAAGVPGYSARTRHGNIQLWALADQTLARKKGQDGDGVTALLGFIHNDPDNSAYANQYFIGLVDHDFLTFQPQDAVGLLFLYDTVSDRLGQVQAVEQRLGLPLGNAATGMQTHEMVIEANYDIHVLRGLNFAPDFQYVIRPNAQANLHDAAVFGFKAHVEF